MTDKTAKPVETAQAAPVSDTVEQENLLKKFDYAHLPEELHSIGRPFYALAHHLQDVLPADKLPGVLGHLAHALEAALAEAAA